MRSTALHRSIWTAAALGLTTLVAAQVAAQPAAARAVTRFVRDPARFKANEAKLVAATRQQSPAMADALQRAFAQDVLASIAPELRRLGLNDADMADMTTAYWVTAWEASQGIIGRQTDPVLVAGARKQIAGTLTQRAGALSDGDKQDVADLMLLQALVVDAKMQAVAKSDAATRRKMSDAVHAEPAQLLKTDQRQVTLTPAGFKPANASPAAPTPAASGASTGTGRHAGNWSLVEGVYFKSYTSFGVGGMMIQDFEPVILFRDGRYYEVEGDALEDVDLAASRAAKPRAWGTWKRQGDTFLLTDDHARTHDYQLQQGSFFKAFPAEAVGGKLTRAYKRISGGGNSAIGGTMAIATQSNLAFTPDGRFSREASMGATGANIAAYSRKPGMVGRYRIERHTISFTDAEGSTRREFFALGSEGSQPRVDSNLIFVGDRVFVKDDGEPIVSRIRNRAPRSAAARSTRYCHPDRGRRPGGRHRAFRQRP